MLDDVVASTCALGVDMIEDSNSVAAVIVVHIVDDSNRCCVVWNCSHIHSTCNLGC